MDDTPLTQRVGFEHRPALDGMRAVAVVVVVAFHAGALDGGWVGVDIFFVLSGWLITGLLLTEISRTGRFHVTAFWGRRLRRLVPALIVTLALVTALAATGVLELRRRGVVGALTYTTNWLNITGTEGYWESFAAPDPLRHLWSLAVEEQIYVVWPVVVLLVLRLSRGTQRARSIRIAAGAVALASIAVALVGAASDWSVDRLYQGTDTRASAFAVGALTAGLTLPRLGDRLRHLIVAVAITVALVVGREGGSVALFAGPIHIITLCGVLAVTSAAAIERGPLCWSPIRRIGAWSYGIYLIHFPITVALSDHLSGLALAGVVLVIATPLAAASHRLIEQPIRRHGVPRRRMAPALGASAALILSAVLVAVPTSPDGLDALPSLEAARPVGAAATGAPTDAPIATPTTAPPSRRVLVIGDSVPAVAADELAAVAAERGIDVGVVARPACIGSPHAADQFLERTCADFVDGLRDTIRRQRPDIVIWWWGGVGAEQWWNGSQIEVCSLGGFAAATEQVAWQQELSGDARSVVVIPPARVDLDDATRTATVCRDRALLDATARRDVDTLRLDLFICPDIADDCERVPRDDGMHVDGEGARTVARWMFDQPVLAAA